MTSARKLKRSKQLAVNVCLGPIISINELGEVQLRWPCQCRRAPPLLAGSDESAVALAMLSSREAVVGALKEIVSRLGADVQALRAETAAVAKQGAAMARSMERAECDGVLVRPGDF